jgi:hypothetical protein
MYIQITNIYGKSAVIFSYRKEGTCVCMYYVLECVEANGNDKCCEKGEASMIKLTIDLDNVINENRQNFHAPSLHSHYTTLYSVQLYSVQLSVHKSGFHFRLYTHDFR